MDDFGKMTNTLNELNISYSVQKYPKPFSGAFDHSGVSGEYDTVIRLNNGVGYDSFHCDFYFLDGKFINHGVWE